MYSGWLVGVLPGADDLTRSEAPKRPAPPTAGPGGASALVVDAYAAQHHGHPSPQATQSVAVARRQLDLPVSDNYFCRRRGSKGVPRTTGRDSVTTGRVVA